MGPYDPLNIDPLAGTNLANTNSNNKITNTGMEDYMKLGTTIGSVGAVGAAVTGIWALNKANTSKGQIETLEQQLIDIENTRPPVIDPYAAISDTSINMTNVYKNLGVATQATEIQMEQTDLALANTLDTLRATGAGAGGATALATAALKSKQNIAAGIEQQEVANQRLVAQGEQQLQQARMTEQQRLQNAAVEGAKFVFTQEDARTMQQLNRQQALIDQERAMQLSYQTQAMTAFGTSFSSLGSIGGSLIGAGGD